MAGELSNTLLASEVKRVFKSHKWKSFQQAEIATGIPTGTLQRLHRGASVKPDTVANFANSIGENEVKWRMIAAGIDFHEFSKNPVLDNDPEPEPDPDELPVIKAEGFKDLDSVKRAAVAMAVEQTAKAMVEGFRQDRSVATIGGGLSPAEKEQAAANDAALKERIRQRLAAEEEDEAESDENDDPAD